MRVAIHMPPLLDMLPKSVIKEKSPPVPPVGACASVRPSLSTRPFAPPARPPEGAWHAFDPSPATCSITKGMPCGTEPARIARPPCGTTSVACRAEPPRSHAVRNHLGRMPCGTTSETTLGLVWGCPGPPPPPRTFRHRLRGPSAGASALPPRCPPSRGRPDCCVPSFAASASLPTLLPCLPRTLLDPESTG